MKMIMAMLALTLTFTFSLISCDSESDDTKTEDTIAETVAADVIQGDVAAEGVSEDVVAGKVFGEECVDGPDCASGVCHEFGQGTWCTLSCQNDDECPEGSEGKKCNKQGVCRP